MGGFNTDDMELPAPAGQSQLPDNLIEQIAGVRLQQERSLQEHQQFAQGLQQQQEQVDARAGDLDLTDRMLKITDSRIAKPARQFLFRELATRMGEDPKGEKIKEIGSMITSLDPDSLAVVRASLTDGMNTAQPGEITARIRGILKGEVSGHELLGEITRGRQPRDARASVPGQIGGGAVGEDTAAVAAAQEAPAPEGGLPAPTRPPMLERPVPPGLASMYGLDPNRQWDMADIIERGYRGPTDEAGAQKFLTGTGQRDNGLLGRDATVMELSRSLMGAESLLREGGTQITRLQFFRAPIIGSVGLPGNQAEFNAWLDRTLGTRAPSVRDEPTGDRSAAAPRTESSEEGAGRFADSRIATPAGETPRTRDARLARQTAELDGHVSDAVFQIGRMAGQTNQALSDADREVFMRQINESTNPEARLAVMRNTIGKAFDKILDDRSGVPFDVGTMTPEARQAVLASGIMPDRLKGMIRQYEVRAAQEARTATPAAGQPTGDGRVVAPPVAPGGVPGSIPAEGMPGVPAPAQPTRTPEGNLGGPGLEPVTPSGAPMNRSERRGADQRREEAARRADVTVQRAIHSENLAWLPEQHQLARESAERDVTRLRMAEQAAQEARDDRAYRRAREARQDAEKRADKISAAFAAAGRMLSRATGGGSSGGGGGGDSGAQDASAFKLAERPQRRAPTPVPARSGHRGGRRRDDD